jgi:hypothetical protein
MEANRLIDSITSGSVKRVEESLRSYTGNWGTLLQENASVQNAVLKYESIEIIRKLFYYEILVFVEPSWDIIYLRFKTYIAEIITGMHRISAFKFARPCFTPRSGDHLMAFAKNNFNDKELLRSVLKIKGVYKWDVQDVKKWVTTLSLDVETQLDSETEMKIQQGFEKENVTGPILLILDKEDMTRICGKEYRFVMSQADKLRFDDISDVFDEIKDIKRQLRGMDHRIYNVEMRLDKVESTTASIIEDTKILKKIKLDNCVL